MRDSIGQVVSSLLKDVHHVPDLGRRAGCDEHRLFSVFMAREAGHRIVFVKNLRTSYMCTTPVDVAFKFFSDAMVV